MLNLCKYKLALAEKNCSIKDNTQGASVIFKPLLSQGAFAQLLYSLMTEYKYMDDSNQHLKHLLKQTDIAFKALMRDPASLPLHEQYERAKLELDSYTASLKHSLVQRHHQHRNR
ncbi:hypothetical protein KUC3_31230 [Alteromonas sp. KC3]|nr:hypothetical protein KUC3_31230 [Alteromonas sp. KC3]BCO24232.1 hypothetical protein KUC14_31010 [Alteromonas sp. KC14]